MLDLKGLFGRKKTINDISMDELHREKIRLEQEEKKLTPGWASCRMSL